MNFNSPEFLMEGIRMAVSRCDPQEAFKGAVEWAREHEVPLMFVGPPDVPYKPYKPPKTSGSGTMEKYSYVWRNTAIHFGYGGKPFTNF